MVLSKKLPQVVPFLMGHLHMTCIIIALSSTLLQAFLAHVI